MSGNANTNFQQTKGQVLDVTSMTQFTATEKLITPDVVVPSGSGGVSTGQGSIQERLTHNEGLGH